MFGLCHLFGYRFAPRIKDLKDRKLYTVEKPGTWPLLAPLIGDTVETAAILVDGPNSCGSKASIETGAVVPSVILRKLAAAGAGNVLSRALRALGRIERTLFTLQWLFDPALRQRSHAGLNKGEASNALRRAVFFHRQGKIRDRTFENQSFRASGLSLITAAIVHWNTVYLDRVVRRCGRRERRFQTICWRTSPPRMGAHRPDWRLRLERARSRYPVSGPTRGSRYVPSLAA